MFRRSSRRLAKPASPADEQAIADINEHGWHCIHVANVHHPEHAEANAALEPHEIYDATFTYTLGLWHTFAHPELVIVGRWEHAHNYLSALVSMIRDGAQFRAGDTTDELLEGYTVRFDDVGTTRRVELLTWADWANRRRSFDALQLVLPDRSGRWPEHADYDGFPQPLLTT